MISRSVTPRIDHMLTAIARLRSLVGQRSCEALLSDPHAQAAFERYFEILSEASRHIPDVMKQDLAPEIPWRNVANLGNHLRHGYSGLDFQSHWNIYTIHLDPLERALKTLREASERGR